MGKKPKPKELAEKYNEDKTFKRLKLEDVREVFSKTTGEGGELDMSHLYRYYHPDIHFQDSIQETHGRKEFIIMMERLVRRCSRGFAMEIRNAAQNGNVIFMHWIMHMRFMGTPAMKLDGTSILTLNEEGLVVDQRDHYDLWGDTFDVIPGINWFYRFFLKNFVG
jgi:limonene-1,2-epoxide hydrolase